MTFWRLLTAVTMASAICFCPPLLASEKFTAELLAPALISQGELRLIGIQFTTPPKRVDLFYDDKALPVSSLNSATMTVEALVGIDHNETPGQHTVRAAVLFDNSHSWFKEQKITVLEKSWPLDHLTIPKNKLELTMEEQLQVKRDAALIEKTYQTFSPQRLWQDNFQMPIKSKITDAYGTRRTQNGLPRSPHMGVDLRGAIGTPIKAAGNGRVVLAQRFIMPGNAVYIDHGQGLFTVYMHMSRIDVTVGQEVTPETVIGLAGDSGKVNAPHLHWEAVYLGRKFDPLSLLTLR